MRNTTIIRGGAVLLALLVSADAAEAKIRTFKGSRDQVRAACKGPGMDLVEGPGQTSCLNTNTGAAVVCYDDGTCNGTGPRTIGGWGLRSRDYQPPQSLVDTGGSSSGSAAAPTTPPAPAPSTPAPPIFN